MSEDMTKAVMAEELAKARTLQEVAEQQRDRVHEKFDALQLRFEDKVVECARAKNDLEIARKLVNEISQENENLRVRLHSLELDVARLRGYQDRVSQFDPVSDREAYADSTPRRRDAVERDFANVAYASGQDGFGYARDERPWFLRRGL